MEHTFTSPFQALLSFMEENQIQYTLKKATADVPFDAVLIGIDVEDSKLAATLQIHHYTEELIAPDEVRKEKNDEEENSVILHILNFIIIHNLEVDKEYVSDIAPLVPFANRSVPFGTINYSETDKRYYYQFSYPSTKEEIQSATFQAIFNTIFFVKELFFTGITDIVERTKTASQIIQDME